MNIFEEIQNVSGNLKWKEIENFCRENNFPISRSKSGYKVRIKDSVWCLHLEHGARTNKLKFGIVRELRRILIKEKILILNKI